MSPRDERLARRHIRQRIRETLVLRRLLALSTEPNPNAVMAKELSGNHARPGQEPAHRDGSA